MVDSEVYGPESLPGGGEIEVVTPPGESQRAYFKIINNGTLFTTLPVISATATKNALDLNGNYELVLPNPNGIALGLFDHFDDQEIWFYCSQDATLYRAMTGQVNSLNPDKSFMLTLKGRGLQGLFTDPRSNDSWVSKRGDFILTDPTFGIIPKLYPTTLTCWNAFTRDYDKFDSWNTARWGAQPAWAAISSGSVILTGSGAEDRIMKGATGYAYSSFEVRAKLDAAHDTNWLGFVNAAGTQHIAFKLAAASVSGEAKDGSGTTTTATTNAITQTNYHYYRIEWDNAEARFFVDGIIEATIATNVPTGTDFSPYFEIANDASVMTSDYVKVFYLTKKFDTYLTKRKIVTDTVSEICDIGNTVSSFTYYIDNDFDFHAYPEYTYSSGRTLGFHSMTYTNPYDQMISCDLNEEAKDLYNVVTVEGGERLVTVVAPNWTDQFIGNGTQTSWALGYKANKPLTLVQVDGVTKIEDTDFSVTYGADSTVIKFNSAPANTKSVNLRYDYYLPIIASANDPASIARYGVTRVYSTKDTSIQDDGRAQAMAKSLLLYYTDPRMVIKVVVPLDPRYEVGETLMVDAPDRGIYVTEYEIIEMTHSVAVGKFETALTLANSEINTNAEVLREILQQLKDLKEQGNTTEIVLSELIIPETASGHESLQYQYRLIGVGWTWGIHSRWGRDLTGDRAGPLSDWITLL